MLSALRTAVGANDALATVQWGLKVENKWEANLKENVRRVGEAKPLGTLRGLDEVDWSLITEQVKVIAGLLRQYGRLIQSPLS